MQDGQLIGMVTGELGPAHEHVLAIHRRHPRPAAVLEGRPGRTDRAIDVGPVGHRDLRDHPAVDRAHDVVGAGPGSPTAVDEQPGLGGHGGRQCGPVDGGSHGFLRF